MKLPKALQQLKNPRRGVKRIGGRKIEFGPIVQQIIASKKYWPVSEVHKDLVKGAVSRFRTMKLLNGQCSIGGPLERVESEGKFWYGANPNQKALPAPKEQTK